MTDCVRGTGSLQRGYLHTRRGLAHRVAWEDAYGPISPGLQVDHLCHDPATCAGGDTCPHRACVELSHLTLATNQQNVLRGNTIPAKWAARTECEKCGGELTPCPTGRVCRPCRTQRVNNARRTRREKVSM